MGRMHRRGRPRLQRRDEAERGENGLSMSRKLAAIPLEEMLAAIEEFKAGNGAVTEVRKVVAGEAVEDSRKEASIFTAARVRPFSLRFDRPEKIIGCKARAGGFEYVIMFKCGPPLYAGFSVTSHAELMQTAPWLLAEYIMERCQPPPSSN